MENLEFFPLIRVAAVILTHGFTLYLMGEARNGNAKRTAIIWFTVMSVCLSVCVVTMYLMSWSILSVSIVYAILVISCIIVYCFVFEGPVMRNLFVCMTYCTYFMLTVSLSQFICDVCFSSSQSAMLAIRSLISLLYIVILLCGFSRKIHVATAGIDKGWLALTFFSSISFFSVSAFSISNVFEFDDRMKYYNWLLLTAVLVTSAYWVIFRLVSLLRIEEELDSMKVRQKWLERELDAEKAMVDLARTMRHDMRHHNRIILEMLEANDAERAKTYLEEYEGAVADAPPVYWSENMIVNSLVRMAYRRAVSSGVLFTADIQIPSSLAISDKELVSLIGNILDNAVEASSHVHDGFIDFSMSYHNGAVRIEMRNSVSGSIRFTDEGLPMTTRASGGVGMRSVRSLVSSHSGMLRCMQEGDVFITQVIMHC